MSPIEMQQYLDNLAMPHVFLWFVAIFLIVWGVEEILEYFSKRKRRQKPTEKEKIKASTMHGLYENGSYVPDSIYDGHYDCGDK